MTSYKDRFINVIEHIEGNLDTALDVERLCQLAYLSKYHFHRQCSAYIGMSLMSLVKLLRLKRAAYQLAYRNELKIIDIALANGYTSHEGFSRAFKKYFNQCPSDFRLSADCPNWQKSYDPIIQLRTKIMHKKAAFSVEIIDFPQIKIATIEHRGPPYQIGKTIQKFIEWRKVNALPPSKSRTFNLVYDDPSITPEDEYRFDVCCAINKDVEENSYGIVNKTIPAGQCAMIRHIGSDDTIGLAVNYLYSEWLSQSNVELRDFPIFFERVSFFPEVSENDMITDIYLPIV